VNGPPGGATALALSAGTGLVAGLAVGVGVPGIGAGAAAAVAGVYATQGLAGALIATALEAREAPRTTGERLARALLLGPLALTAQMLLMAMLGLPFGVASVCTPWWLLAAVLAWRGRRPAEAVAERGRQALTPLGAGPARRVVLGLAVALVLLALVVGLQMPVHTGDAMNNYAVNARVFETQRGLAPQALAALTVPGHTENPPLVALNEALIFLAAGPARAWAIKPFFALAYGALLLLVIEACFRELPARRAAPVALGAFLTPIWAAQASDGYADLRLTACVLLLALEGRALWRAPTGRALAAFVAAALACAALKHEGIALAGLACLFPLLAAARRRLPPRAAVLGIAVLAALSVAWPLYAARNVSMPLPLVNPAWHDVGRAFARLPEVLARMAALTSDTDAKGHPFWGVFWPAAAALAAVGLARPTRRPAVLALLAALALHAGLYVAVFALTPEDLAWQMFTAGTRLVVHLSPWALLLAVAALGSGSHARGAVTAPAPGRATGGLPPVP
jgi:hypothetical protein